jgi:3-oxoacyl-(acyl-carrier-protein) synthase
MDAVIGDCHSASSSDDDRMHRRRRYAIRTVMSAVAEAGLSDTSSYAPSETAPSLGELPTERERYYKAQ